MGQIAVRFEVRERVTARGPGGAAGSNRESAIREHA